MIISGVFLSAGFFSFLFFQPFNLNIPNILTLFFLCFAMYLGLILRLKVSPPIVSSRLILLFSILFRLPFLFTSPTLSDDVYRYVWDGKVQQAGINPYVYPPSAPELDQVSYSDRRLINHPNVRTVYPPFSQFIFRLGVAINPSIGMQKILFTIFDVGVIFLLLSLLKRMKRPLSWVCVYAWNPLVVIEFSGSGHNDSLMLFFLILAANFYERNQTVKAAVGFSAATLSKLLPVVMIPWLLIQKNRKLIFLYGVLTVLACVPFMRGLSPMWSSLIAAFSGVKTYARDWVFNSSFYGLLGIFFPSATGRKVLIGIILTMAAFYWAKRNQSNPLCYALGCLYAVLLLGPVVHPWYVTWIIPFLCFYPLWSGVLWSGLVFLAYTVLIAYARQGIWQLPLWVPVVEYVVVYSMLIFEGYQWLSRSSSQR